MNEKYLEQSITDRKYLTYPDYPVLYKSSNESKR